MRSNRIKNNGMYKYATIEGMRKVVITNIRHSAITTANDSNIYFNPVVIANKG